MRPLLLLLPLVIACSTEPRIPDSEVVGSYDGPLIAFAGDEKSVAWIENATEPAGEAYGRNVWQLDFGSSRIVHRFTPAFEDRAEAAGPDKLAFADHQLYVEQFTDSITTQLVEVADDTTIDLQLGGVYTYLVGVDGPFIVVSIADLDAQPRTETLRVLDPHPGGNPWTMTIPVTPGAKLALGYGNLIIDNRVITLGVGDTGTLDYAGHMPRKIAATPDGALMLDATGLYRVSLAGTMQRLLDDPAAPFTDSARDASIVAVGDDVWTSHNPPSISDPADSLLVHIDATGVVTTIPIATDELAITRAADSLLVATADADHVTFYRLE